jgi:hypothetical protein
MVKIKEGSVVYHMIVALKKAIKITKLDTYILK